MKQKFLLLCVSLCITLSVFSQDNIYVYVLSGENYKAALSEIGVMTIKEGMLRLFSYDGTKLAERNLEDVKKITFKEDGSTDIIESTIEKEVSLNAYPNPTQNALFLSGLKEGESINIFSTDGQLIRKLIATGENMQIEVSSLKNGIYLLQSGLSIIKFIKE